MEKLKRIDLTVYVTKIDLFFLSHIRLEFQG